MVSSICDLVEEKSITDARRVCRECAQGKRSSEPWREDQGDILQQVQKVNEAMKSIHKELNSITLRLDHLGIKVSYMQSMQDYRNIQRKFQYITEPEKGFADERYLEDFLKVALDSNRGLDRIVFDLFDMVKGVKGDFLSSESIFKKAPISCEARNLDYIWNMITDCIFMEEIAHSLKGSSDMNQRKTELMKQNLMDIADQYVKDCGCQE